uniref:Uncharacterized protein n=1 Tax=Romanomermis culicivorax TaxID=13658 RepID=A0A915JHV8_ROMCU
MQSADKKLRSDIIASTVNLEEERNWQRSQTKWRLQYLTDRDKCWNFRRITFRNLSISTRGLTQLCPNRQGRKRRRRRKKFRKTEQRRTYIVKDGYQLINSKNN